MSCQQISLKLVNDKVSYTRKCNISVKLTSFTFLKEYVHL